MSVIGPSSRITPASPRALAARRRRGDVVAGLQVHGGCVSPYRATNSRQELPLRAKGAARGRAYVSKVGQHLAHY